MGCFLQKRLQPCLVHSGPHGRGRRHQNDKTDSAEKEAGLPNVACAGSCDTVVGGDSMSATRVARCKMKQPALPFVASCGDNTSSRGTFGSVFLVEWNSNKLPPSRYTELHRDGKLILKGCRPSAWSAGV